MTRKRRGDVPDEHEFGMCRNGRGGLGCSECSPGWDDYPEGGNAYAEAVAGVPGVTFGFVKRPALTRRLPTIAWESVAVPPGGDRISPALVEIRAEGGGDGGG